MRLAAKNNHLDCERLQKPKLLNPRIEYSTQGRDLLQFQVDQKVKWQECNFQEVVDLVTVESIVAAVDAQYVEEIKEEYLKYKNQTIMTTVTQIRTIYDITTKEKLYIKAHFLTPWSYTPYAHVATFERQLDRRQVDCKYHGFTITNNDKVDHFVAQMYACGLFEAKFLDDWEDTANKSLGDTHPHFTW